MSDFDCECGHEKKLHRFGGRVSCTQCTCKVYGAKGIGVDAELPPADHKPLDQYADWAATCEILSQAIKNLRDENADLHLKIQTVESSGYIQRQLELKNKELKDKLSYVQDCCKILRNFHTRMGSLFEDLDRVRDA